MRKLTIIGIILAVLLGIGTCVWAVVYCNGNPQAALCQSECDEDDWAEGDSDCDGLEGPNAEDTEDDDFDYKKPKPVQPKPPAPKPITKTRK